MTPTTLYRHWKTLLLGGFEVTGVLSKCCRLEIMKGNISFPLKYTLANLCKELGKFALQLQRPSSGHVELGKMLACPYTTKGHIRLLWR